MRNYRRDGMNIDRKRIAMNESVIGSRRTGSTFSLGRPGLVGASFGRAGGVSHLHVTGIDLMFLKLKSLS